MQEIERKFLLYKRPLLVRDVAEIRQGYLSLDNEREVRVRSKAESYFLTCKGGFGLVRDEWEIELTTDQWLTLWPATAGRRLEKSRGTLYLGDHEVVVDIFEGSLHGLCIAEIEFDSEQAAREFNAPDWFGKEVTTDRRFANRSLAANGLL